MTGSSRLARLSLVYAGVAFLIGFLFGALREWVLVPAFAARIGAGIEFPLATLAVIALGAWLAWRRGVTIAMAALFGLLGTVLLVLFESAFAMGVLRESRSAYLAAYDLTGGALFPVGLVLMALTPAVARLFRG
jgi:hypothetical protein